VDGVNERVSQTICPFCGIDDWISRGLVGLPTTEVARSLDHPETDQEVTVMTLAAVVWLCANCGFIRAHSIAPDLFE
jgi:hypothetical protein